ncbi:hypothetical protein EI94DRAFT_1743293 [Lactarius quietus]|nr:hypothetical protein EI94DRAFT_1743293 [Lactarius quietus]
MLAQVIRCLSWQAQSRYLMIAVFRAVTRCMAAAMQASTTSRLSQALATMINSKILAIDRLDGSILSRPPGECPRPVYQSTTSGDGGCTISRRVVNS